MQFTQTATRHTLYETIHTHTRGFTRGVYTQCMCAFSSVDGCLFLPLCALFSPIIDTTSHLVKPGDPKRGG